MKEIQKEPNERFWRINEICKLIAKTPLSTSQIADKLGVSERTIQRDLNGVLAKYGAVRNGRLWSIDESKIDPKDENQIILAVLDKMAKNVGSQFYAKAHGLLKGMSEGLNHPIFVSLNAERLESSDMELLESIESAILSKNKLCVSYYKKDFVLSPVRIALFDGFWYLLAFDGEKFKKFHFKSLKNMRILDEKYSVDESIIAKINKASSVWFDVNESFSVRLWVDKIARRYFERKPLPNQQIMRENEDGSIEIEVQITHIMEIKPLIFYYLPRVKVIEPQSLADEILAEVEGYVREIKDF